MIAGDYILFNYFNIICTSTFLKLKWQQSYFIMANYKTAA